MRRRSFQFGKRQAQNLILDNYSTPTFAYSLCRKLNSSYNGSIFRVYGNTTGNHEIGFTNEGLVDEVQLQSILDQQADGILQIVILYDQSGNGRDIGQALRGNNYGYFEIARAGSLHRASNGKIGRLYGSMIHDGLPFSSGELSSFIVAQHNINGSNNGLLDCANNQNFSGSGGFRFDSINGMRLGINGNFLQYSWQVTDVVEVKSYIKNNSGRFMYRNNIEVKSDGYTTPINYGNVSQFKLCAITSGTNQYSSTAILSGYFQEAIAWDADMLSDRASIEQNQIDFYIN